MCRNQTGPMEGFEDGWGWGWMSCKESLGSWVPTLFVQHRRGTLRSFFACCPMCPHVQRMATPAEAHLPTHNAISTFFSFTALSTKTRMVLPLAPFRHTQIPQLDLLSGPASRSLYSYPHCPKPQLSYDYKVTSKCEGHRLNIPSVGEPQREIRNCELRR